MLSFQYFRPVRNAIRIFSAERSPRQIAAAIALGVVIGLLPKGNLLAVAVSIVLFSLRVNLGVGLTVAFVVSLAGPTLAELTHGIGVRAFQSPTVYRAVQRIYDWPLVPWTNLNNTIVLGSAVLGLVLVYPIYHVSYTMLAAIQRGRRDRSSVEQNPAEQNLGGEPSPAEIAASTIIDDADFAWPTEHRVAGQTNEDVQSDRAAISELASCPLRIEKLVDERVEMQDDLPVMTRLGEDHPAGVSGEKTLADQLTGRTPAALRRTESPPHDARDVGLDLTASWPPQPRPTHRPADLSSIRAALREASQVSPESAPLAGEVSMSVHDPDEELSRVRRSPLFRQQPAAQIQSGRNDEDAA